MNIIKSLRFIQYLVDDLAEEQTKMKCLLSEKNVIDIGLDQTSNDTVESDLNYLKTQVQIVSSSEIVSKQRTK